MTDLPTREEVKRAEILGETAKIGWSELQRFFANGSALFVAEDCDLVEVACQMAMDNKLLIEKLLAQKKICPVSDQQAVAWLENDTLVWTVVIKPWVLVQPEKSES